MLTSYSNKLRKIAELIERDNTPSDAVIGDQSVPLNQKKIRDKSKNTNSESGSGNSIRKDPVKEDVPKSTAMPVQRRPRRQLEYKKKWNEESSKDNMREYMTEYRARGDDKNVDGLKSTYHKKLRTN